MLKKETHRNETGPAPERIYVNRDLRDNPTTFVITIDQLPVPTVVADIQESIPTHTLFTIFEKERNSLHIPVARHSLNVAQFVAIVSAMTEGLTLGHEDSDLPIHFKYFQDNFKEKGELSLITFDMDDLTLTNRQYTHLHGSIVCSTLERTILESIEQIGGLLASMGEENIVALPMSLENAHVVGETILQRFTSIPFDFGAGEFHQGVSLGIASLNHSEPRTFRHLMELSGGALVHSKKNGKGRITMFADH